MSRVPPLRWAAREAVRAATVEFQASPLAGDLYQIQADATLEATIAWLNLLAKRPGVPLLARVAVRTTARLLERHLWH